ncbi:hypothetical protein FRC11_012993 [Ceratobasidium sp. 423]|nr:hypothetical protein FRC11_012993 [Ceratobasidium sp. 423]
MSGYWSLVDFICDTSLPDKPTFIWPNLDRLVLRFWKGDLWQSAEGVTFLAKFLVAHPKLETLVLRETCLEDSESETAKQLSLAEYSDSLPALKRLLGSPRLIAGVLESRAACLSVERVIDNSEEGFDRDGAKAPYIDRIMNSLENAPKNRIQRLRLEVPQLNRDVYARIARIAPGIHFLEFLPPFDTDNTTPNTDDFNPQVDIPTALNNYPNLEIVGVHIVNDFAEALDCSQRHAIVELAKQVPNIKAVHGFDGIVTLVHRQPNGDASATSKLLMTTLPSVPDIEVTPNYPRDPQFYFQDGSIVLLVKDVLFKVHATLVKAESQVFEDMFTMPIGDNIGAEGTSDQRPIVIPQVEPAQFRNLMKMLYFPPSSRFFVALQSEDPTQGDAVAWENFNFYFDVARLAHRFAMVDMEQWAKSQFILLVSSSGKEVISRPHWGHPAAIVLLEAIEYAQIIQDLSLANDLRSILQYYLSKPEWTTLSELLKVFRIPDLRSKHPSIFGFIFIILLRAGHYTSEVDALIPEAESLAQSGQLQAAVEKLLVLEKQARNSADAGSTSRLLVAIIKLCRAAQKFDLVNSNITLLAKKHGQLKAATQAMVEEAMTYLPDLESDRLKWLELIEALRSVTEGKIFLETSRARVTLALSLHHERLATQAPDPAEALKSAQTASDLLSELQVETYSSMTRREKTEFLLEQMRLLVLVANMKAEAGKSQEGEAEWIKVRVGGRKVNEGFLKEAENEDLKLKYYELMIKYALHNASYLDAAKHYYKVWETPSIKAETEGRGRATLEHIIYYVVLASHSNEQSDMLHRLYNDPELAKLDLQYNLAKCFVTRELMRWPGIEGLYGAQLRETSVFGSTKDGDKRWEDLHMRVIEHNIRVISVYYTRITLDRLTGLLDLPSAQTEETLCKLVVDGSVWARIDRPKGIVNFRKPRTADDVLNAWSADVSKMMGLVEKASMGINAELAARAKLGAAS